MMDDKEFIEAFKDLVSNVSEKEVFKTIVASEIKKSVVEAFREILRRELRPYDDNSVIHVGEVCTCLRKAYYNRVYGSKDLSHLDENKVVILGLGLSTHLALEEVLREKGYRAEEQILYKTNEVTLAGTPDLIFNHIVLDIKTVNKIPPKPYDHHVKQVNAYIRMANALMGFIVYICKRDGRIEICPVEYDEEMFKEILERAKVLKECLEKRIPPPKEVGFMCNYCEWEEKCVKDEY